MIKASLVAKLRAKTGAAMMDCKKALVEADGDFEQAVDLLRKKGLSNAAKKTNRAATEGLVGILSENNKAVIVELNSETDFVAKNEIFQELLNKINKAAIKLPTDVIRKENMEDQDAEGEKISEMITDAIAKIGENIKLRRSSAIEVENGIVSSYIHNQSAKDKGKIGVLVALESELESIHLEKLGREMAMHIAAARPQYLSSNDIDPEIIGKEKEIFTQQFKNAGKDDKIIPKMVEGRLRKLYQEVTLLGQAFVMDSKVSIEEYMQQKAKELGNDIKITDFIRYEVGEGIEKEEDDFASEVEKLSKKS